MSTTTANQLGELIVRRRAVLGLSQLELCARAAVDIKTLQGLEAGTTQSPRAVTLGKIAKVMGVDVAELLRLGGAQSKKVNGLGPEAENRQAGRNHSTDASSESLPITDVVEAGIFSGDDQLKLRRYANETGCVNAYVEPLRWPKALHWCHNEELAALCAARLLLNHISTISEPSVVWPTGRTSAFLFKAIARCLSDHSNTSLFDGHFFIDTETYGVNKQHPSSRHRFVLTALQNMIKGTNHALDKKRVHFFDGVFRSGSDLNQYDALLRDHQPDIHIIALSPNGEVVGYDPGCYDNNAGIQHQNCSVLHLSEDSKNYIDAKQPSRAIISIGMNHVLHARRLLLLVLHANKARVFGRILRGPIDSMLPASLLRFHRHVEVVAVQSIAEILEEKPLTVIRSDAEISDALDGAG